MKKPKMIGYRCTQKKEDRHEMLVLDHITKCIGFIHGKPCGADVVQQSGRRTAK